MDLEVLDQTAARLLAIARAPSPYTLASYTRRWRMWEAFVFHYGIPPLPAEPEHVAAFVVARWRAGVGDAALAANLSAIRWFHTQLGDELGGTCDLAKRVLGVLRRRHTPSPLVTAPVLSVGALAAMTRLSPAQGTRLFSARVLRLLTGARPRALAAATVDDVVFGPDDRWVELTTPELPNARFHPALPVTRYRFDRGLTALDCPVRALRTLVETSADGMLMNPSLTIKATIKGFNPASTPTGVPVRIAMRNRAIVCVGYQGALRVQELVRARVEHLEPAGPGLRLRLHDPKTSKSGASQFVLLRPQDAPLDPVSALHEWLAVRGDHDGSLFCSLHHARGGGRGGAQALSEGEIRNVVADLAAAVGLTSPVSGYSLRRSWATHAYLRDPHRFPLISTHLRHRSIDQTTRYIDDLGLHLLDADQYLSTEAILASPGGVSERRRDLGFDPAPLGELLDEVSVLAKVSPAEAPSSTVTHRSHWNVWQEWADARAMTALPAAPDDLVFFSADRARSGVASATLRAQLRTIRRVHEHAGHDAADLIILADEIAIGLARAAPREKDAAPVLSIEELADMAVEAKSRAARTGELSGLQDLVILAVSYAGALRLDDLWRARIEFLDPLPYGYALRFGASKENQTGRRPESVLLLSRSDDLDPVAAIDAWRDASGMSVGPLVPVIGTDRPLSKDSMPDRLRRLATDAGVATRPTGHSLRRSWATHAYERGVDPVTLSRHLRHRDLTTTLGYVDKLSPWVDNVARFLMDCAAEADVAGDEPCR